MFPTRTSRAPLAEANRIEESYDLALPPELQPTLTELNATRVMTVCSLGLAVVVAWAAMTPLRETAYANGELVPMGQARNIQHFEGGIVADLPVREGSIVKEGQPILSLSAAAAASDRAVLMSRREALEEQRSQLLALIAGEATTHATGAQKRVFESRSLSLATQIQMLQARVQQRRAELESLEGQSSHLTVLHSIQEQHLAMKRKLFAAGHTSNRQLLEAETALEQVRLQRTTNRGQRESSREALLEAERQLDTGKADARRQWSEEAAKIEADLAEANESLEKHDDRVRRLVIRAPVDGAVLQIVPRSIGETVKPGDVVARVVPSSEPLIAEVRIKPSDLPHVKNGSDVRLVISGLDPRTHGELQGQIKEISPSSFKTEQGEPYFRGLVTVTGTAGAQMPPLGAGMVVRAEISTGAKTLLRYLLRPVYDAMDRAFAER